MALYQPSNITPSSFAGIGGGVVDANDPVRISWQVNGTSPLIGFQIDIYDNDAEAQIVDTLVSGSLSPVFYGTDEQGNVRFYVYEPGDTWADHDLENGKNYKMKITQYWSDNATGTHGVRQDSFAAFVARSAPVLSISPASGTIGSVAEDFSGTFSQAEGDAVASARWILSDGEGTVLEDTGTVYTGYLAFSYNGFLAGQTYTLSLTVVSSSGVTVTAENTYVCSYESASAFGGISLSCNPDDSVTVTWAAGRDIPGVPSAEDYGSITDGVLHLAANRSILWNTVNGEPMSFPAPFLFAWRGEIGSQTVTRRTISSGAWEEYQKSTAYGTETQTNVIQATVPEVITESKTITVNIDVTTEYGGQYTGRYIQYPSGNEIEIISASLVSTTADTGLASAYRGDDYNYFACDLYDTVSGTYSAVIRYTASIRVYKGEYTGSLTGYPDLTLTSGSASSSSGLQTSVTIVDQTHYSVKAYGNNSGESVSVTVTLHFSYTYMGDEAYRSIVTGVLPGVTSGTVVSTTAAGGATVTVTDNRYTVTMYHSSQVTREAVIDFGIYAAAPHSSILSFFGGDARLANTASAFQILNSVLSPVVSIPIEVYAKSALVFVTDSKFQAIFYNDRGSVIRGRSEYFRLPSLAVQDITLGGGEALDTDYVYVTSNPDYDFISHMNDPVWDGNVLFYASFREDLQAGTVDSSDSLAIAVYRRSGTELTPLGTYDASVTSLRDWGMRSQHEYSYVLYYVSNGVYSSGMVSDTLCRRFRQYTLIEAEEDPDGRNVFRPVSVWRFRNNIEAGAVSNGNTPALLDNFTKYPHWQPSSQAPRGGTLTALLSFFTEGQYLSETAEDMDRLYALSSSVNPLFLRDMKGNLYLVRLSGPVSQTVNTKGGMLEVTVSLPWIEAGDASDAKILETGA